MSLTELPSESQTRCEFSPKLYKTVIPTKSHLKTNTWGLLTNNIIKLFLKQMKWKLIEKKAVFYLYTALYRD